MVCPKCGTVIDENSEVCYNCQMEFKHAEAEKLPEKMTKKSQPAPPPKPAKSKLIKIAVIAGAALVVIIIAAIVLFAIFKPDGRKISEKLRKEIGEKIVTAEATADIHLTDKSESKAINKHGDFDYIYESEDMINVDGVKVPKWLIKVEMKDSEVFSVYYRDYTSQKGNYKGEKLKNAVDISKIDKGMSAKKVEEKFDIKPISIIYYKDSTEYRYSYYFINGDKDEEHREAVITFDEDMKVTNAEEIDMSKTNNPIL